MHILVALFGEQLKIESYKKLASEVWSKTWDLLTSESQWVKETPHQDLDSGIIYSQRVHGNHHHGKIFMLEVFRYIVISILGEIRFLSDVFLESSE